MYRFIIYELPNSKYQLSSSDMFVWYVWVGSDDMYGWVVMICMGG